MPGAPYSKGCNACRKQKKKCDQKKPSCSRCERLLIECVGAGVKRIKFEAQAFQIVNGHAKKSKKPVVAVVPRTAPRAAPRAALSNKGTRLANRLVSMFELKDMRYDIFNYGLVLPELPRHIGYSPALDGAVTAIIAAFDALHNKDAQQVALARQVDALAALGKAMEDPIRACTYNNMCAIYILNISQGLVKQHAEDYAKHGQILSHLIHDVAIQGRLHEFRPGLIRTFCATTVIESFYNHDIELDQWFWDIFNKCLAPRPIVTNSQSLISIQLNTIADIAVYLRAPTKYLYQIRVTYDTMQSEHHVFYSEYRAVVDAAAKPDSTYDIKRLGASFIAAFGTYLGLVSILNRILHIHDHTNLSLLEESSQICQDTVSLARDANPYRPLSAAVAGNTILIVWASVIDSQKDEDLESVMVDYADEFDRVCYWSRIFNLTDWYGKLEKNQRLLAARLIDMEAHKEEEFENTNDTCIVI